MSKEPLMLDHDEWEAMGCKIVPNKPTRKTYNGHPSYNAWNVSLWLNNDERLYETMCYFAKLTNRHRAAKAVLEELRSRGQYETPDGVPYTVTNIKRAMVGLK